MAETVAVSLKNPINKTGQEETDVFWINEGNDNLEFGTSSIYEYYNTLQDC